MDFFSAFIPPKDAEISLWPNTRVCKWGARQRGATHRSSRASSGQIQMREQKNWGPNTRGLSNFSHIPGVYQILLTYRAFIRVFPNTGGLSDFLNLPGVYRIFFSIPGVYRIFYLIPSVYRTSHQKSGGLFKMVFIGSTTKNPGVYH